MPSTDDGTLLARVGDAVAAELDPGAEWSVARTAEAAVAVALDDRRLEVERRDGPDGGDRYTLTLATDGETVSKHGPFASVAALVTELQSLLNEEVGYTVCCDG